jgi:periplasmic protein TonB
MDFSKRHDSPHRHLVGIAVVVLLHVLIVYALVNGLGQKVVELVRAPVETQLIEEAKVAPAPEPKPPEPKPPEPKPPEPPPPEPQAVVAPKPTVPRPRPAAQVAAPAVVPTPAAPTISIGPGPSAEPVAAAAEPAEPPAPAPAPVTKNAGELVGAGIACSRMPAPEAPNVSNEVRGTIFVRAVVKNGRVVQVDMQRHTMKSNIDRRTLNAFFIAIETAMKEGYVCNRGHAAFRQEFFFDIP